MATSPWLRNAVQSFEVGELTKNLSDHRPITCTLNIKNSITNAADLLGKYDDAPRKITWDHTYSPEKFTKECTENSEIISTINEINTTECETERDVLDLNTKIVAIYNQIGIRIGAFKNQSKVDSKRNDAGHGSGRSTKKTKMKQKWFDAECIAMKRDLIQSERRYVKSPTNDIIRSDHYSKRREYKKFIKCKKLKYFKKLGVEILYNNNLSWKNVKQLKSESIPPKSTLDIFDMKQFYTFFKNLYNEKKLEFPQDEENKIQQGHVTRILNAPITNAELSKNVRGLKNGKSNGLDNISNEFLKASNGDLLKALTKLFNLCLEKGVYPWNTTVITPLHKKGDIYNPDNYRAIAVGSNLGKLFSSIMLERLIQFRKSRCPDTENQLGFCQQAQTADHLFSLHTCIEKYVKKEKSYLYSCFVDFRKAFDTVCREALLYKLATMGVDGKFFNCMSYMYKHSKARIKIISKLSDSMDILCGTEQGHPVSPELFKMYIHKLSLELNEMAYSIENPINVPELNGESISHLLWADDLVLLARDRKSLQKLIEKLKSYCDNWGLEVSISNDATSKTAIMIFNTAGRQLKESYQFNYGARAIPSTKSYTYLGIMFTLSGSLRQTQQILRQKGLRAYFGMKKYINTKNVSKSATFKLFDSLVLPVATYGSQIWLPMTKICNVILEPKSSHTQMTYITSDPIEKLHLSFLKWTLGVPKQTSNAAVYGDTGRKPTTLCVLKQFVNFFNRLSLLDKEDSNSIARHAFAEQQRLKLPWYSAALALTRQLDPRKAYSEEHKNKILPNALLCEINAQKWFTEAWKNDCRRNKKLKFYCSIKENLGIEPYLTQCSYKTAKAIARLRMSSHGLNIETGRYGVKQNSKHYRCCPTCTDPDAMELIMALPGEHNPIVEDELHILKDCSLYGEIRRSLDPATLENIASENLKPLFNEVNIKKLANYVNHIFKMRFPKSEAEPG